MKIGLDVLGGDFAPNATLHGAIMARKELPDAVRIVLIGDEDVIRDFLREEQVDPALFDIINAPDIIEMDEQPTKALVNKPDSSIATGFRMLKHREIQAFASAGSSGAMMVGSIYSVNTVQGIIRPSTPAYIPKENGGISVLIDVGTNPDSKSDILYQFGLLGSLFSENILHVKNPRVGLLNIVLKQIEAMYRVFVKRGIKDEYLDRFNYEIYGGSPILGINGTVVVGHGISNGNAIRRMIHLAREVHDARLSQKIHHAMEQYSVNNK
jgi:glycerol-3-phosphate acyltransferase PlsX